MKTNDIDIPFGTRTSYQRPYIYRTSSITSTCIKMAVLLLLQLAVLVYTGSYAAVHVILCSFLGAVLAGVVQYYVSHVPLYTLFPSLLAGLLSGFLFPENYPRFAALILVFFLILIINFVFSGFVNNWVNPVILITVLAWFTGKKYFPSILIDLDSLFSRNPSLMFVQDSKLAFGFLDSPVTDFLNKTIFGWFKVSLPNGYLSFFWDNHSIIPAFRFNFLNIISSIVLFSDDTSDALVPSLFLFVYLVLVRLFAPFVAGGALNTGDMILALFSSGTLFFAVFIIGWFGTLPMTLSGRIILGIFAGLTAFLVTGAGTSFTGMTFTVLLCNLVNLFIRMIEDKKNMAKLVSRM
ncbi:MAG: RnfABCDGE type electron transport complex subunit D [Treponema sp.]|nr:RnfABCDGE type electron transport complex subunit D [Treponema sp.]